MTVFDHMQYDYDLENIECQGTMVRWFTSFVVFCPCAAVVSTFVAWHARNNFDVSSYTLEKWRYEYRVYSNKDPKINVPLELIEAFNFIWALIGIILNESLADETSNHHGAIRDCAKDYGIVATLIAFMYVTIGLIQIIRFLIF